MELFKIKLSLIIPIYGVENYISGLLESLLPQLNKHVECIFVNDGTKNKSFDILKKYLTKYPENNYQLLEQENQGLSMARNNGMKLVKGDYFGFIDSDDEVEPNYIEKILNVINNKFDIMHFNATYIKNKDKSEINLVEKTKINHNTPTYLKTIFEKCHWYACFRIFNKNKYQNKLKFPRNKTYEDILAIPECYEHASSFYDLKVNIYRYFYRETSISNNFHYKNKNLKSYIYGIYKFRKKINNNLYKKLYFLFIEAMLINILSLNMKFYLKYINLYQKDIVNLLKSNTIRSNKRNFLSNIH